MAVDDSYTKLLLHCNGDNDSQTFIDESGKTVTANGAVKISTTQKKFGPSSAYFDGSSDYLSLASNADFAYGTGAFTIDFWFRATNFSAIRPLYSHGGSNHPDTAGGMFFAGSNSKIGWYSISGQRFTGSTTLSADTWYHVAIVGNGGSNGARTIKFYIDGSLDTTYTLDYNFEQLSPYFGANEDYTPECMLGYMDEIRVSKGIERWTAPFTPPTKAYGLQNSSNFFNFF